MPPAVAQIVMRCLEKDPAQRYQTAEELLVAIESLVTPTGAYPPPVPTRGNRARRLVLGAAGLVAVVAVAFVATGRMRRDRWVHETAIPELKRLIEAAENDSAFTIALEIQDAAPNDSTPAVLWPRFTQKALSCRR